MPTDTPSKEEILNYLIKTLFEEIQRIRRELSKASPKKRTALRRELRNSSLALADLLQTMPEESDMDEWLAIIQEKAPKKFAKYAKQLLEKSYRDGDFSGVKFTGMTRKDAGTKKVSKR